MTPLFWTYCLEQFQKELSPQQFNTWIKPLELVENGEGLQIVAPNRFVQQWVKDKFGPRLSALAEAYFHEPLPFDFAVRTEPKPSAQSPPPAPAPAPVVAAPEPPPPPEPRPSQAAHGLNLAYTFETFVNGKANQLARAAALQVSEHYGQAYNPLFVYGGVGLGKTHLIQAIGHRVLAQEPGAKILYLHAERYVSDVVKAYQHKAFDEFKRYYHSLDVLLIDDIQFFAGKNRTQEEFFYAFNALIEAKSQLIITCDTYPRELSGIEERLVSRFNCGLTVAIEPPELEMRVAILLKKASIEGLAIDENVAFFIAKEVRSNVRELEGALKRVSAYALFTGQPISIELAREALKDLLAVQQRQVSLDNIKKTVAEFYKIKLTDLYSKKRSRAIARPRQIAMALAKELTHLSLPEIGDAFGGRDHTTVLHACRKVAELRNLDVRVGQEFAALIQILRG